MESTPQETNLPTETPTPTTPSDLTEQRPGVIWDDSLIIKSYDGSLELLKEDVAKMIATKTNQKGAIKKTNVNGMGKQFKVGDYVRSTFTDGVDYEARIVNVNEDRTCDIKYIGYENEETVKMADLIQTWGQKARRKQKKEAKESVMSNCESSTKPDASELNMDANDQERPSSTRKNKIKVNFGPHFMPGSKFAIPPPPPMPPMLDTDDEDTDENDSMSAMLMSWYMAGYYAGYYQAQKRQKST